VQFSAAAADTLAKVHDGVTVNAGQALSGRLLMPFVRKAMIWIAGRGERTFMRAQSSV
jgi:hypothetical protein